MSCPVRVVARVHGEVVADAVPPAVRVFGAVEVSMVMITVEVDVGVVYLKEKTVTEVF